jgi:cytochrome c biogenesis protein CcdA/thiol-disulfide isomerase/thioredoxin
MAILLAFAFVSGIVTILSPCILPVLPIVLSGGVTKGKARPLGILAGFVVSFSVFTLALTGIVKALGIPADSLRFVSVVILALFGLVMLVPRLSGLFEIAASKLASAGPRPKAGGARAGFGGGIVVGLSLGLVWTPCVGPIMASVISLALTQKVDGGAALITLAYSLGTAIPMAAVMLGGRALMNRVPWLSRNGARIQRGFGALILLVGISIGFGWDRRFQALVLTAFPSYGTGLTALETAAPVQNALKTRAAGSLPARNASAISENSVFAGSADPSEGGNLADYGLAPQIVTQGQWFNSAPLDMAGLRGKVVVVDFWTYSCINCVRTIPYLRAWYDAYKDKGLVVIGVHSPEFEFEKVPANVSSAMKDLGVTWPVVQDNDYKEWQAYGNNYWPAHYFIDAKGRVRYIHYGEGEYATSEKVIQTLLAEAGEKVAGIVSKPDYQLDDQTPETYLGYTRARGFSSAPNAVPDKPTAYKPARVPGNGEWNLDGEWTVSGSYIAPKGAGTLEFGFKAKKVYLVIEPQAGGGSIGVWVDGKPGGDTADVSKGLLKPGPSRLYQLVDLPAAGSHVLRLEVKGALRLFAFTFG